MPLHWYFLDNFLLDTSTLWRDSCMMSMCHNFTRRELPLICHICSLTGEHGGAPFVVTYKQLLLRLILLFASNSLTKRFISGGGTFDLKLLARWKNQFEKRVEETWRNSTFKKLLCEFHCFVLFEEHSRLHQQRSLESVWNMALRRTCVGSLRTNMSSEGKLCMLFGLGMKLRSYPSGVWNGQSHRGAPPIRISCDAEEVSPFCLAPHLNTLFL